MLLPYKIATLLYVFNSQDEVLLIERAQEPNRGLWSPPGGKLKTDLGESPYTCGCREAGEEMGMDIREQDLHLTGLISESGYQGHAHWLMFLFEVRPRWDKVPETMREGRFGFFSRKSLPELALPETDRERIWPWFWAHRGGFFAAHCRCLPEHNEWRLEASLPSASVPVVAEEK